MDRLIVNGGINRNMMMSSLNRSFFGFFCDNFLLLDLHFFETIAIESIAQFLDDVWLFCLEGEQVTTLADFELCDFLVFLDEDGYITTDLLFLGPLAFGSFDLLALIISRNFLNSVTSRG